MKCSKCNDTGIIDTGNNDLPCDCPAGNTAVFNEAGVEGPVTGAEVKKHFLNNSPDPIEAHCKAEELPGRRTDIADLIRANVVWRPNEKSKRDDDKFIAKATVLIMNSKSQLKPLLVKNFLSGDREEAIRQAKRWLNKRYDEIIAMLGKHYKVKK